MAKSRSRSAYGPYPSLVRVDPLSALLQPRFTRIPRTLVSPQVLTEVQDRRVFHPDGRQRAAISVDGTKTRQVAGRSYRINFAVPDRVMVCVRRKIRDEVLHALKLTGRGSGRGKKRFNVFSGISCKR